MLKQTGEMCAQRTEQLPENLPMEKPGKVGAKKSESKLRLMTPLPEVDEAAEWIAREAERAEANRKMVEEKVFAKAREKQLVQSQATEKARIEEIKRNLAGQDTFYKKVEARKTEDVDKVLENLVGKMRELNSQRSVLETKLAKESAGVFAALRRFKVFGGATTELEIAKIDDKILMVENQMEAAIERLHAFSFRRKGSPEEQILKGIKPLEAEDEREIKNWFTDPEAEFMEKAYHGRVKGGGWNPEGGSFLLYEDGLKVTLNKDGKGVLLSLPDGRDLERAVQDLSAREVQLLMEHQKLHQESDVMSRDILQGTKMDKESQDAIENWFIDPKAEYDDEVYALEGVTAKTRKALEDNVLPSVERKIVEKAMAGQREDLKRLEVKRDALEQKGEEKFGHILGFGMEELQTKKSVWGRLLLKARLGELRSEFAQWEHDYNELSDRIARVSEEVVQDELWLKDPHQAAVDETRTLIRMLQRQARAVPGSSASGAGEKAGIPAL